MDHRKTPRSCLFLGAALFLASGITGVAAEDPLDFFEKRIRPIFAEHCYECHSAESGKSKGGLLLDSRADILRGGDSGAAIIEKDPERSKLIEAVRWKNQDFQMPPKRSLSESQISDL
jgi:mono/diheme cytochrome c family protein